VKERFNAVEAYEEDYIFEVKSQAADDSPFSFPVESVVLIGDSTGRRRV
jgi:hypothetical protein